MAKLLLVEDDSLLIRLYQNRFTKDGHEVVAARDGEEGLVLIEREQPDLVLLDIMMPKLSGLEMLERIKANPATRSVPVVILSNVSGEAEQERALELGAVAYIVKSANDPGRVAAKVREILQASTRDKELPGAVSLG
ncbi:MAG: response regulator [Candidatus Andersenbacteria bacterium]|nr:response regulator [Candidatus Andersenbacteria bacterium]